MNLSYTKANKVCSDNLFEVEVGLFDVNEDPNTPLDTYTLYGNAENTSDAEQLAEEWCIDNIPKLSGEIFTALSADKV